MLVNINRQCLIREKPRGVVVFNDHFHHYKLDPEVYRKLYLQPDGRLKMELWQMAFIYGSAMFIGKEPPIETDIEILNS